MPGSDPPFLALEGLSKSFGLLRVLDRVSLSVAPGEIVALLGPSGSGKSTLLRLIAGFEEPDAGRIVVAGESVEALPPNRRGFGMVFQSYALFPHLTVEENVAFGLQAARWPSEQTALRVKEALGLVDLEGFERRRIAQISGGQQQRVALARALAPRPRLLMLDEPLSNLDPALRERTRAELRAAIREVGITTLLVTHEQEEAFDLGDRVALLNAGVLQQVATPRELYEAPATRFVAAFVGRSSFLPGFLVDVEGSPRVRIAIGGCEVQWPVAAPAGLDTGRSVDVLLRPEALELRSESAPDTLPGRVKSRRYVGPVSYLTIRVGEHEVEVATSREVGSDQSVRFAPKRDRPLPRVFADGTGSGG